MTRNEGGARTALARRRANGERGTAVLELAIIVLPLFLIAAGILEIGLLYRSGSLANSGSRSGARLAATIWPTTADANSATVPGKINDCTNAGCTNSSAMNQIRLAVETDLSVRRSQDTPVEMWIYEANSSGYSTGTSFASCSTGCVRLTWSSGTGHFVYASGTWTDEDACGKVIDSIGVYVKMAHSSLTKTGFGNSTLNEKTVIRLEPLPFDKCNGEAPLP